MKKLMSAVVGLGMMSSVAYATGPGFYLGGQLGQSNLHNESREVNTYSTPPTVMATVESNTGLAGRVFLGYSINKYAGVEGGYSYYRRSTYTPSYAASGVSAVRESGFDFVGKGMYPFPYGFGVFGKAGIAVIRQSLSGNFVGSATTNYVRPTVGIGASYDITPNWVVDASWSEVFKGGSLQKIDFIALGVSYHFVSLYCGQFLC